MAEYLGWAGKLFSNVKGFYSEMNPATLTGANDVIIIRQEDGTFKTSPWDIRFGKMGVFWANENNVDVEINGKLINLPMKLGAAGEAIFVVDFESQALLNCNASNSIGAKAMMTDDERDALQEQCSNGAASFLAQDGSFTAEESGLLQSPCDATGTAEDVLIPKAESLDLELTQPMYEEPEDEVKIPLSKMRCNSLPEISMEDLEMQIRSGPLSDNNSDVGMDSGTEDDPGCIVGSLPSRPNEFLSLKELNNSKNMAANWPWDNRNNNISYAVTTPATENKEGQDRRETSQNKGKEEGIYLDQVMEDPELMSLYLYPNRGDETSHQVQGHSQDVDCRSDPGLPLSPFSAPHSPVPFDENPKSRTRAMSFSSSDTEAMSSSRNVILESESVVASQMARDGLGAEPSQAAACLSQVDISLCGGLEDLHESALREKFEQHKVTFKQFVSSPNLMNDPTLVVRIGGKFFKWAVASSMIMSMLVFCEPLPDEARESLMKQHMPQKSTSHRRRWLGGWFGGREKEPIDRSAQLAVDSGNDSDGSSPMVLPDVVSVDQSKVSAGGVEIPAGQDLSGEENLNKEQQAATSSSAKTSPTTNGKRTLEEAKGLTLSAKQIELMNLHEGRNEVTFSITTKYQGTTKCYCSVFLWNWFDKIVISDIDGTITKSDVLGQVLPIISSTWIWSQVGIANLYTLIHQNGYKFIYLSARAIGQAKLTRDYLRSVKQGEYLLPDGPLLLSPSSLRNAFHKEVIERKPEEFKIKCLRDILTLFPSSMANPFMAGFGNRVNDVFAYNTVGIPKERIFIVNTKGQLRIEKSTTFTSTYSKLSDIVDQIFPPVAVDPEFSSFNYWRDLNTSISEEEAMQFLARSTKRGRRVDKTATTSGSSSSTSTAK